MQTLLCLHTKMLIFAITGLEKQGKVNIQKTGKNFKQ